MARQFRHPRIITALPILVLCTLSCDNNDVNLLESIPSNVEGPSRLCLLKDKIQRLGSNDALASPEEKPGWTRFTHDVWMDSTEMTQAEYRALRGKNPSKLVGDSLPVTNVSWFDAVLAANARSKRDKLDSVYEYASVQSNAAGNATGLTGLTVHLDRTGWRLPTEAEWEAAARAGTTTPWSWGILSDSVQASASSWYQRNAGGVAHPVATKSPNAWGLHDMAGNVMEWVNDWKGSFPKDTIDDFAGPESPGDVAEVPLKGGAYAYGISHLRPSSRTGTYAAYRSARAEYVGFRLARGAFTASYTSSSGQVVYTPPVTLVRSDVARLMGSWEARLVFVNRANGKGTLTWIDYGEANPVARSMPDKDPVFHPVISPDGRWVAWSTVLEGSNQPGRIKIRRLARNDTVVKDLGEGAIPRWWVDGTDTFLVRANPMDNLASGWSSTKTTAQRWSNGTISGTVQTWVSAGSYHDGRSGQYLYTGYRRLRQYAKNGKTSRVLFTGPENGKNAGDTSQVCNVSAAPDGSGRVMFLDFGYTGTSSVVGRSYGIHEVAFVSDSTGAIKRQIVSPAGETQWEHMEWSNSPRWAVSGAIDGTSAYHNLYLVDIDSAKATRIVSGEQLWQPAMWTGSIGGMDFWIDLDSIGQYFLPKAGSDLEGLGANLLRFWLQKDSTQVALVGSSQLDRLWPSYFPKHKVASLSWAAGVHSDYDSLIRNYLVPNAPRLKVVVLTLMPGWFFPHEGGWPSSRWEGGFNATLGNRYDAAHGYWKSGLPGGFIPMVRKRMESQGIVENPPISMIAATEGWGPDVPEGHIPISEDTTRIQYRSTMARIESLLEFLTSRGIHVIVLHCPEHPAYRNMTMSGFWGPSWPTFKAIMARAKSWEAANAKVHIYDANKDGLHDYKFEEFGNANHLAGLGHLRLSSRLDSLFTIIIGK